MSQSSSTNRPVIAGRRLAWEGGVLVVHLRDENGKRLYRVERMYDSSGKALHDPVTGFGFQYKVTFLETGEELGIGTYLGSAKLIAERHFAKSHNGKHEGYWTSRELTRKLGAQLD